MGESRIFNDLGNLIYVSFPVVILASVGHTIFTDNILKQYYLKVLYICFCFLLFCCLIILSGVYVLRRKAKATKKPVRELQDSDLESDEEVGVVKKNESNWIQRECKKLRLFSRSMPIYGLVAANGILFLLMAGILQVASRLMEKNTKEVNIFSGVLFTCGLFLQLPVWRVERTSKLTRSFNPVCKKFDEAIAVPMKVLVREVFIMIASNIFRVVAMLFYQLSVIYGLVVVFNMTEDEIRMFAEATQINEIHRIMVIVMSICNLCGLALIVGSFWMACELAKEKLLDTFVRNWRQNLIALDFFLAGKEVKTLEELRDAFLEKSQQQLSEEEQRALKYIERPLWETKSSFNVKYSESDKIKIILNDSTLDEPDEMPCRSHVSLSSQD